MEDFSPIFWIVLVVGGLIYSAVSQARKAAGKEGGHPHSEAWPSFDPEEPRASTAQPMEEASSSEEIFEDEGQSLEEIPEYEYSTPEMPQKKVFSKFSDLKTEYTAQDTNFHTLTAQSSTTANQDNDAPKPSDISEITASASVLEDFDLRQAVIYTEILKPKFDE